MANAKKKSKALLVVVAVMVAAVMLLGGTFAWQSISQEALNEVSATVNPGGRLHDDFHDITDDENGLNQYPTQTLEKNVYVENYTSRADNGVQIYARVRLDEYMEFGVGAGGLNDAGDAPSANNKAVSLVKGAELADKTSWTTYIPGNDQSDLFRTYWNLSTNGGRTVYMPTFNKDNTSLEPDVNGTAEGINGVPYADYVEYAEDDTLLDTAVYESDNAGNVTESMDETHTATVTLNSDVITMDEWLANPVSGDFWVQDVDGWYYWANPINPDTATGLLLDQISRTDVVINSDWYYAINVVGQFVTYDDIGSADDNEGLGSGFYADNETPTANALALLGSIGVEVGDAVKKVTTATTSDELTDIFADGGFIALENDVFVTTEKATWINSPATINLNGGVIASTNADASSAENYSALTVAADTLISNGTVQNEEGYGITLKDVDDASAVLTIKSGNYYGNTTAINVVKGTLIIEGGFFAENSDSDNGHYLINCIDANYNDGSAKVIIKGGTFVNWNPAYNTSEGAGTNFLAEGYTVQIDNTDPERILYTVVPVTE